MLVLGLYSTYNTWPSHYTNLVVVSQLVFKYCPPCVEKSYFLRCIVKFLIAIIWILRISYQLGAITIKWVNNDERLKDYNFLWSLSLYHKKDFWDEIFCNMLLKIHISFSIRHIFCNNFSWITDFFKIYINSTKFFILFWKIILVSNCMKIC
jgi:hypothetical protein